MKKIAVKLIFIAVFALFIGGNVFNFWKYDLISDVALANVEALASGEGGDGGICRMQRTSDSFGMIFYICSPNGVGASCVCGN